MGQPENFYEELRYEYNLNEDSIVFDIGAHKGVFTKHLFEKFQCNIYAFDPIKEFLTEIPENKKIHKYPYGISNEAKTAVITVDEGKTSLYIEEGKKRRVKFIDLAEFIDKNNIKKIDLIKFNIEGEEYKVLNHLINTGTLKICQNIQIQFHPLPLIRFYKYLREDIMVKLSETHIQTWCFPFVWENWEIK